MKGARYGLAIEGWPFVIVLLALAAWAVISSWPWLAVLPAALLIYAILQFRDPPRTVPADPLGVVSPVDGTITDVARLDDGIRLLVSISIFSPYLLRSPTEGKVSRSGREHGGHGLTIRTDEGEEVWLRLRGPRWLPPAAAMGYGERMGQGQRCGLLRAARTAEIWLPLDSEVLVQRDERVRAGESVIGRFHRNDVNGKDRAGERLA